MITKPNSFPVLVSRSAGINRDDCVSAANWRLFFIENLTIVTAKIATLKQTL